MADTLQHSLIGLGRWWDHAVNCVCGNERAGVRDRLADALPGYEMRSKSEKTDACRCPGEPSGD
jgi:hypothetical protein